MYKTSKVKYSLYLDFISFFFFTYIHKNMKVWKIFIKYGLESILFNLFS